MQVRRDFTTMHPHVLGAVAIPYMLFLRWCITCWVLLRHPYSLPVQLNLQWWLHGVLCGRESPSACFCSRGSHWIHHSYEDVVIAKHPLRDFFARAQLLLVQIWLAFCLLNLLYMYINLISISKYIKQYQKGKKPQPCTYSFLSTFFFSLFFLFFFFPRS